MNKKIPGLFKVSARENNTAEILLYGDIGRSDLFDEVSAKSISKALNDFGSIKNIDVRINSGGGEVFEGVAIYNLLLDHPAAVVVQIDGVAASIASVIAMAADPGQLSMANNAMMMIHDPWAIVAGTAPEIRKQAELLDQVRGQILDTYIQRAGNANRPALDSFMNNETWFTATEAHANGLVDNITGRVQLAASYRPDLSKYHNVPGNLLNTPEQTIINKSISGASAAIDRMSKTLRAYKLPAAGR